MEAHPGEADIKVVVHLSHVDGEVAGATCRRRGAQSALLHRGTVSVAADCCAWLSRGGAHTEERVREDYTGIKSAAMPFLHPTHGRAC